MASVNKVILVGNLGRDPEVRYLPSGDPVATLSVATTESYNDKQSGQKQELTEWHRVVFFGKTAEVCAQYLKKGGSVYVEGSIRTRKWTDQSGQERYSTEIRGDRMQMLGGRQQQDDGAPPARHSPPAEPPRRQSPPPSGGGGPMDMDDDIPFLPVGRGLLGLVI